MAGITNFLANELLDHTLRNSAYTPPATVYLGLCTTAPSATAGGTEPSGNNYGRAAITSAVAASGATSNSAGINFPTPSGSWGACSHWEIWDASTAGNRMYFGALSQTETPISGNTVTVPTGDLDISMA